MNIITIAREYGAGGSEVARKLAETLGWELLDRELLHRAAEIEHVPDAELERLDKGPSRSPTASTCTRPIRNTCTA